MNSAKIGKSNRRLWAGRDDSGRNLERQQERLQYWKPFMDRPRPVLALMEEALALLERVHDRWVPLSRRPAEEQRGIDGERAAYFYLRRLGYIVVAREWTISTLPGDVDLIGWDGETLCFVEVKTRNDAGAFAAELSVDREKTDVLRRLADAYLRQLPHAPAEPPVVQTRFDVISVYMDDAGKADIRLLRDFFA
jgi:putative endonuclease